MFTRLLVTFAPMLAVATLVAGCPTSPTSPSGPPCDDDSDCHVVGAHCEGGGVGCTSACDAERPCPEGTVCVGGSCTAGTLDAGPRDAGRPDGATRDAPAGRCDVAPDADGDGDPAIDCGGHDCDDSDPDRSSLNEEESDDFNRDEDCNPCTVGALTTADADRDLFFSDQACNVVDERPGDTDCPGFDPAGPTLRIVSDTLVCGTDCDDTAPGVFPTAPEACDRLDNDCDDATDEDGVQSWYPDIDGDGYGSASAPPVVICGTPAASSTSHDDCNDGNPNAFPGAVERCNNADDNCNGSVDEGNPEGGASCFPPGRSGPCVGTVTCVGGATTCVQNDGAFPRAETCNDMDDDCNGTVDLFSEACTNLCGSGPDGSRTCNRGSWGGCDAPPVNEMCSRGCGSGTLTCDDGARTVCDGVTGSSGYCTTCASAWPGGRACRSDGSYDGTCVPSAGRRNFEANAGWLDHDANSGYVSGTDYYTPWMTAANRCVMRFDGLPSGRYTIRVSGTTNRSDFIIDGVWVDFGPENQNTRLNGGWSLETTIDVTTCSYTTECLWYRGNYGYRNLTVDQVSINRLY